MPATAGHIGIFGNAVVNDLFGGKSSRNTSQHIAVIGKKVIGFPVKYLSDGQLNAIVTGIWRMIGPSYGLFKVIGGTIVKRPAKDHQVEPFSQNFLIRFFNVVSFRYFHCSNLFFKFNILTNQHINKLDGSLHIKRLQQISQSPEEHAPQGTVHNPVIVGK